jgi:hypothetical protein
MSRADEPAYPAVFRNDGDLNVSAPTGEVIAPGNYLHMVGLSVREHFAAMAMQGLIASDRKPPAETIGEEWRALWAVKHADALIAELAKPVQP